MKFSQDSLISGLRKRGGSTRGVTGPEPKRSCQRESGHPGPSLTALPEAILVEEGEGEENPPAGIPIGRPAEGSLSVAASSPVRDAGEPSESEEAVEARPPSPPVPKEASVPASSDALRSLPRPPRTASQSASYKSCLSETVLKLAILPKFQAILRDLPLEESFDTMFTAALQMSNGLFVLREDLINTKSRNESLSKELSEAKARESKALDDLRTVQEDSQSWRERAEKELKILDAKLSEVRAKLLPTEEKLKGAVLQLEHTENRADSAEAAARDAAEKLALAEKDTKEALDRMAAMEAKALERLAAAEARAQERVAAAEARAQEKMAAAEARVREAVNEYKNSPDFASELHEAAMDAFVQGFERCKRRLSQHFKLGSLEHFHPEDDEETSNAEVENAAGETTTVRDPATEASTTEEPASEPTTKSGCLEDQ